MRRLKETAFTASGVAGAALLAFVASGQEAQACSTDGYIGSICYTGADYCPEDYLRADGKILDAGHYSELFVISGDRYGGYGQGTFGLPNTHGRELISQGQGPGLYHYSMGQHPGREEVAISIAIMSPHTHTLDFSNTTAQANMQVADTPATETNPLDNYYAQALLYAPAANDTMAANAVVMSLDESSYAVTGNMPPLIESISVVGPQLGVLACVRVYGDFPHQPPSQ